MDNHIHLKGSPWNINSSNLVKEMMFYGDSIMGQTGRASRSNLALHLALERLDIEFVHIACSVRETGFIILLMPSDRHAPNETPNAQQQL